MKKNLQEVYAKIKNLEKTMNELRTSNMELRGGFNLEQIESDLMMAEIKLSELESLHEKARTAEANKEISKLKELIPKVRLKLMNDKLEKSIKSKKKKLVVDGLFNQNARLEDIEHNPFPTKLVKRPKMKKNKFNELYQVYGSDGKPVFETIEKKLYAQPRVYKDEQGRKIICIPKGYSKRLLAQSRLNLRENTNKHNLEEKKMFIEKIGKSKLTVVK